MLKSRFEKYGSAAAEELWTWTYSQARALKATAEKEGIDCDLLITRSLDAYFDAEQARSIKTFLEEQRQADAEWTHEVQWLEGPNLERVSASPAVNVHSC